MTVIFGTNSDDFSVAGDENDLIFGLGGNDNLAGRGGNDNIFGGNGNDYIAGSGSGASSNDNDNLFGEKGNDTLIGEFGNDYLNGGAGNDALNGAGRGGSLSDPSFGRGEIDILTGGAGKDSFGLASGGRGASLVNYQYEGNKDYALITDFNPHQDTIGLLKTQFVAGSPNVTVEYSLGAAPEGLPPGTGIYVNNLGEKPDLIAILLGVDPNSVSLSQPYFQIS